MGSNPTLSARPFSLPAKLSLILDHQSDINQIRFRSNFAFCPTILRIHPARLIGTTFRPPFHAGAVHELALKFTLQILIDDAVTFVSRVRFMAALGPGSSNQISRVPSLACCSFAILNAEEV